MNRESRMTILLDAFEKDDDDEVVHSMMRVYVDCLKRATCPGCGWCNDLTLASRHSATPYKVNISHMQSDAALARQIEESDAALVRQRILREESASALALAWHNMPRPEGI